MDTSKYDALLLSNQLCFPLYACSREIIKRYKPYLDELELTYTQYITLMVLWEHGSATVKELGDRLHLDSGTLTPLLKKMEAKGMLTRKRCEQDERSLLVTLTDKGMALRERALNIPEKISSCVDLPEQDARTLYRVLYAILDQVGEE